MAADQVAALRDRAAEAGVGFVELGVAGGDRLVIDGLVDLALAEATVTWRDRLPSALGHGAVRD